MMRLFRNCVLLVGALVMSSCGVSHLAQSTQLSDPSESAEAKELYQILANPANFQLPLTLRPETSGPHAGSIVVHGIRCTSNGFDSAGCSVTPTPNAMAVPLYFLEGGSVLSILERLGVPSQTQSNGIKVWEVRNVAVSPQNVTMTPVGK